jgi:hypothetical protein
VRTTSDWMRIGKLGQALVIAAVLVAGSAAFVLHSCSTVGGGVEGNGTFANPLGGDPIRITFGITSGTTSFAATGGAGLCIEIEWRDATGKSLGRKQVTLPGSGQVPPGAVSWSAKQISCSGMTHLVAGGGAGAGPHAAGTAEELAVFVIGGPVRPDTETGGPFLNAIYTFRVELANPAQDALEIVLPILAGGLYATVPPNVEVLSYTQIVPGLFGADLIVADTEPFDVFRLDWNGQQGYADLASGTNVVAFQAGAWRAVRAFIPLADFHGTGIANTAVTLRSTVSESETSIGAASCRITN